MEPPGRSGDWLAPPPSPPRAHAPGRHDERGVGTSIWPPAGTYTWPSAGTFPWPWTVRAPLSPSWIATRSAPSARAPGEGSYSIYKHIWPSRARDLIAGDCVAAPSTSTYELISGW